MKKEKGEDKDEFDALIEGAKPLDARLGTSPEKLEKKGKKCKHNINPMVLAQLHKTYPFETYHFTALKQSTLPFKPVKKKKGKGSDSDESDEEINFDTLSPPPVVRTSRRAAAGN